MVANEDTVTGGGREAKREAILEAATKVFMEVGFGAASMDSIATEAKVSKQTVYNHFGSKEELFGAMIRKAVDRKITAFIEAAKGGKPEETLRAIARQYLNHESAVNRVALYRILMADAPRFPELGEIFYSSGPELVRRYLAEYLAEQHARGTLHVENPRLTAEQYLGMLTGCHLKAQFGIERLPTKEAVEAYIDNAVGLIMRGCAPRR